MDSTASTIAQRLSLRAPQGEALERLAGLTELLPMRRQADRTAEMETLLAAVRAVFPSVQDFERDFPSVCFALATGVGKTRLMGAFIGYLNAVHGIRNFFVLAPNLTIYEKLITDFTPNTPKYVLRGLSDFAVLPPMLVTGETFERQIRSGGRLLPVAINIFNSSKINAELRSDKLRMRTFREEIGSSYFDHLAGLDDLVLIMDESHRYRASAGVRALNELNPLLGLELTATPFVETSRGTAPFRNVIYDYPLARAIADGFVKEPAVVTCENFSAIGLSESELERIKLEDGVRLHESVKVELETHARNTGERLVKPFVLVIARNISHAAEIVAVLQSPDFAGGRYAGKVIQVDSSVKEEETIKRLLRIERAEEATEIVVHVNMLKEGWDVNNLYTIVPLRAANARTLIEQSIGRGLRLPFGKRTGIPALDRLSIVAHDRFQEIVEEARRPGSVLRLAEVILPEADAPVPTVSVESIPLVEMRLGLSAASVGSEARFALQERPAVAFVWETLAGLERQPDALPDLSALAEPAFRAQLVERLMQAPTVPPAAVNAADLVDRVAEVVAETMISIPRIMAVPEPGSVGVLMPFRLDLAAMRFEPPSETLWIAHLSTGRVDRIGAADRTDAGSRLEDIVVDVLSSLDDVAYEFNVDVLQDLAAQVAAHLRSQMDEASACRTARFHGKEIARFVRAQMPWRVAAASGIARTLVTRGFTLLRPSAYSIAADAEPLNFRRPPRDRSTMGRHLFGGFSRCLYPLQKFDSDPERVIAVILDRDALKWFRPSRGQFQIFYRLDGDTSEYQPDFVAETFEAILMIEVKGTDRMTAWDVLAKRDAAVEWCRQASMHALAHGGKPWRYLLVPHDRIAENMSLEGLVRLFRTLAEPG
ncbi:DEAD/DEAH box helicase [Oryzicola mucosus]|uniref:DEAD/DEAH box helicase family protein n=1 Tax=Oryzicola mucosus TaxID=2767425 RepID=A0A8J6PTR8_9HYPH|nr:DEAD/DEAH box helicase family protein [Oryzicola mucosus]MBD0414121.1 DEAD/DEAH box helicase family protein [Oryzicola mucosus]